MNLFVDILVISLQELLVHLMVSIYILLLIVHHYIDLQCYQNSLHILPRHFLFFYNVLICFEFLIHLHHFHHLFHMLHLLYLSYNKFLHPFLNVVFLLIYILHLHFYHFLIKHHISLFQIVLLIFVQIYFFFLYILILLECFLLLNLMLHH